MEGLESHMEGHAGAELGRRLRCSFKSSGAGPAACGAQGLLSEDTWPPEWPELGLKLRGAARSGSLEPELLTVAFSRRRAS